MPYFANDQQDQSSNIKFAASLEVATCSLRLLPDPQPFDQRTIGREREGGLDADDGDEGPKSHHGSDSLVMVGC